MSQLLEHILNGDYVSANDLFESHMEEIAERKLYETKRMMQAEAVGGDTPAQRAAKEKAGYVRASAPVEKGGLGLSFYDVAQQKKKERLAAPKRKAAPALANRPAADRSKTAAPSTGKLKTVDPSVYKPEGLKAKRDRLLTKARELDPMGSSPETKKRESKVKSAYYAAKTTRALKSLKGALGKAGEIKGKVDDMAGRFAGHFGSSWE